MQSTRRGLAGGSCVVNCARNDSKDVGLILSILVETPLYSPFIKGGGKSSTS